MDCQEVKDLNYIVKVGNLPSIKSLGILCKNRVSGLNYESFALEDIQKRRSITRIPSGGFIHDYVNLFFNARNATLLKVVDQLNHKDVCVLLIDKKVLELDDVIISDTNAAGSAVGWPKFKPYPEGLEMIDTKLVYTRSWYHDDPVEKDRRKARISAEVLVPHIVEYKYVIGAIVPNSGVKEEILVADPDLRATISSDFFFNKC